MARIQTTKCPKCGNPECHNLTGFRVFDVIPALDEKLRLNEPALLILSDEMIEGRIVAYSANIQSGYEITIESKAETESSRQHFSLTDSLQDVSREQELK